MAYMFFDSRYVPGVLIVRDGANPYSDNTDNIVQMSAHDDVIRLARELGCSTYDAAHAFRFLRDNAGKSYAALDTYLPDLMR